MDKIKECVICNIIANTAASFVVYQDQEFIAFLDIHPLFPGHCLLAPLRHFQTIYDLPIKNAESYFILIQKLGRAIESATQSAGTFIAVNNKISQSIPHLHTHIVPRNKGDGLKGFFWPRQKYKDSNHMREIQVKIKQKL